MIALGLLFVLVPVGVAVFVALAPTTTAQVVELTTFGVTVKTSALAIFLAGAASVVLLGLAYALITRGTARKARSRKELRQLRKEQAAAGTSPSGEGGHRSSRHDRHQKDVNTEDSTETSADSSSSTSADSSSLSGTGPNIDKDKAVGSDRHQESEPPTST
jgi:hypothetical protein